MLTEFHDWDDGEWHEPIHDGYLMACCDCGLVHRVDFAIRDGEQVQMRWFREDDLTAEERDARNITVEH
jgi:hypothetical protein